MVTNPDGSKSGDPVGLGIARVKNGVPTWAMFAGHSFNESANYSFNLLRPDKPNTILWDISSVDISKSADGRITDRALCLVGDPTHLSKPWTGDIVAKGSFRKATPDEQEIVQSSITGEKYFIVGVMGNISQQTTGIEQGPTYVVDYASVKGESGSCFYGETTGDFYTLANSFWLDATTLQKNEIPGPPRRMSGMIRWRIDKE